MNPYLAKLRALEQATPPLKAAQGGFVSFVSTQSSPDFELAADQRGFVSFVSPQISLTPEFEISKNTSCGNRQNRQNLPQHRSGSPAGLNRVLDVLGARCPDHVEHDRWRLAVEDGKRFLAAWGEQAQALGWTARELFGLHTPPDDPAPSYRRLSRYDATGLIWLLEGREVTALTADTAAIRWPSGPITIYRKNNKPAFGPLGDSLDDFQ
jgi:hypothetical protein